MTLDEKFAAIEAGLKGVTQGPWESTDLPSSYGCQPRIHGDGTLIAIVGNADIEAQDEWDANAAHIARLDPQTVAEIIAERKADKARIVELEAAMRLWFDAYETCQKAPLWAAAKNHCKVMEFGKP